MPLAKVTYPVKVGQKLSDDSTVIAWGYWDDEKETVIAVLCIIPERNRVAEEANYKAFLLNLDRGRVAMLEKFMNIVPAVEYYRDELGMDY